MRPGVDWNEWVTRYWLMRATIPAKVGAAADVPPTTVRVPPLLMRNPLTQLGVIAPLAPSSEQNKYPS